MFIPDSRVLIRTTRYLPFFRRKKDSDRTQYQRLFAKDMGQFSLQHDFSLSRENSSQLTGQFPINNRDLLFAVKSKNLIGKFLSNTDWKISVKH
jgi:hypothetical protein